MAKWNVTVESKGTCVGYSDLEIEADTADEAKAKALEIKKANPIFTPTEGDTIDWREDGHWIESCEEADDE
jgi:hypothetical protein